MSLSIAGFIMVMNCWNVRYGTRIQDVFAYAKVLALIIIIGIGFYFIATGKVRWHFVWTVRIAQRFECDPIYDV